MIVVPAGAEGVAERLAEQHEVRGRVAGTGVPGRVGERLDRDHPVPVDREVVVRQAAQHPGEHRRGEVGPPPGGQHAEPLVVHDMAQPRILRLPAPPEEAVPGCARQRSGPEPDQRDPLAVQDRDVAQHLPGQPMPEPVMSVQLER